MAWIEWIALFVVATLSAQAPAPTNCREWHACRDLALEAQASGDFERFHDLAWRAVQTGRPHDPDLMYLLARAQSLSGRPHDALVMLSRLVEMGVAPDADTSEDFRRVRALPEWPELLEAIQATAKRSMKTEPPVRPAIAPPAAVPKPTAEATPQPAVAAPPPVVAAPVGVAPSKAPAGAPTAVAPVRAPAPVKPAPALPPPPAPTPAAPAAATLPPAAAPILRRSEDAIRLPATALNPSGVAYDRASARFVLVDRPARKLVVVDERLHHQTDLVGAESAGFFDIRSVEIDNARGDLWVVSATDPSAEKPATVLHKLQLVSGRPIASMTLPARFGRARFDDVSVGPKGTVFVLDGAGGRIFRLAHDGRTFESVAILHGESPVSLAASTDRIVYVADARGIARVDAGSGSVIRISAPKDVQLGSFQHIRWTHDALVGIQRQPDGTFQVAKVHLSAVTLGLRASGVESIERDVSLSDPSAAALLDDMFYFVQRDGDGSGASFVVRRARVQ